MQDDTKKCDGMASLLDEEAIPSPYHPAYGLPDDFRFNVARFAASCGNDSEAARRFNVSRRSVGRWRRAFTL